MYNRKEYLDQMAKWQDKPVIKVITGMRRSGKSTLIKLFINHLQKQGISKNRILYINKESLQFEHINTHKHLFDTTIIQYKNTGKKLYIFVDEIQLIEDWEKAIISLFSDEIADIYITGSNARMLSEDLATLLGGRYIKIPIYPLTLDEFLLFSGSKSDKDIRFNEFLQFGGLPGIHHLHWEKLIIYEYLGSVFDTIVLKDIVRRNNIRNVALLEKIIYFIFDNIGQIFSAKRVADFLKKEKRRINIETVYNYINFLIDAHVVYRVPRYDIKGKRHLEVREKYFLSDIGLRHAILGYRNEDIGQLLENIVFIELKKRGYKISIGQLGESEVDFIVEKEDTKVYLQITYLLSSQETMEREYAVLIKIKDNYPKYVISLDKISIPDNGGIKHLNLFDFLLSKKDIN